MSAYLFFHPCRNCGEMLVFSDTCDCVNSGDEVEK